jgi:hypothetical protein
MASAVVTLGPRTRGASHAIAGRVALIPFATIPASTVIPIVSSRYAERRGRDRPRSSNRGGCGLGCSSVMMRMLAGSSHRRDGQGGGDQGCSSKYGQFVHRLFP